MTNQQYKAGGSIASLLGLLAIFVGLPSCSQAVESTPAESSEFSQEFEHASGKSSSPWLYYSPKTVPTGDFKIEMGSNNAFEGEESLHFDVVSCSDRGGRLSPGLTAEWEVPSGSKYKFRFAVRNEGCEWRIRAGGISAKHGEMKTIPPQIGVSKDWQVVEIELTQAPEFNRVRFELSILSPGKLWLDAFQLEVNPPTSYDEQS